MSRASVSVSTRPGRQRGAASTAALALAGLALAWALGAPRAALGGPPAIGPAPAFTPPSAQVLTLGSGARAWVQPRPGWPLVHVVVHVGAGSLVDPPGKAGLALLAARSVEEGGAGERSGAEVLAAFDALGVELETAVSSTGVTFSVTCLASKLEPALRLLVVLLSRPRFAAEAFESAKARQLAEIAAELDTPDALAERALRRALYGEGPLGWPATGSAAAVAALGVDDVRAFHEAFYRPERMSYVVTGDLQPVLLQSRLEAATQAAGADRPPRPAPPAAASALPSPIGRRRILAVDRPGLPQSVLRLGRPGLRSSDPRLPALEIAATVLGGSFTSRLNQSLRERHGYTYGVQAQVAAAAEWGEVSVGCAVRADVTAAALRELMGELRGRGSLSAGELDKGRALLRADVVRGLTSGLSTAWVLTGLVAAARPSDELARRDRALAAVDLAALRSAADAFDPDTFSVVVVGDRARVEADVARLFAPTPVEWVPAGELR